MVVEDGGGCDDDLEIFRLKTCVAYLDLAFDRNS
jgi:hypothetical protein